MRKGRELCKNTGLVCRLWGELGDEPWTSQLAMYPIRFLRMEAYLEVRHILHCACISLPPPFLSQGNENGRDVWVFQLV